jgi:flagellar hook-associated protein 3 FlgL
MRVTSTTYSNMLINSSNSSQYQLAVLQQEVSSGNSIQFASDNPLAFQQALQNETNLAKLNSYTSAASTATTDTSANYQAMSSIHQIMAQASEYVTGITTNTPASSLADVGTEMQTLLTQLTSTVNQQSNGNYLFGGTANLPPLDSSGNYNTSTNGSETSVEVGQGNSIQTGIVAGRPTGTPPVDGFLYDSSTGVDVVASLKQAISDLNSGNASAVLSTDAPAISAALDHVSMYVGKTAASMAAVTTASNTLTQQTASQNNQLNSLTQTNLATASLQLQQVQNQYQASLEAGTRLMNLSILNYMSSVGTA